MCGIERRIDKLGRVVLPISYRNKLGLCENTKVTLSLVDDKIIITPANDRCLMCGNKENINKFFGLCRGCIEKIKKET